MSDWSRAALCAPLVAPLRFHKGKAAKLDAREGKNRAGEPNNGALSMEDG